MKTNLDLQANHDHQAQILTSDNNQQLCDDIYFLINVCNKTNLNIPALNQLITAFYNAQNVETSNKIAINIKNFLKENNIIMHG